MHPDGLIARCRQCGGNVELRLAGPPIACSYCGAAQPLDDATAARLERLRIDVARHHGAAQQLVGKQRLLGQATATAALVGMLTLWIFIGVMLWLTPAALPPGVSLGAALFHKTTRAAGELAGPVLVRWWFLFAVVSGVSFNLLLWAIYRLRAGRLSRTTWPRPPAAAGRPPRCRCCGADLPAEGSVRRCGYCDAEHVVMGQRYQRHQASLDAALSDLRRQVDVSLQRRERSLARLAAVSTFVPLSMVLLMPAALFAPATYPVLWAAPAGALVLAFALIAVASATKTPAPRSLDQVQAGDGLIVSGTRYEVQATLSLTAGIGWRSVALLRAPASGVLSAITIELGADDTFSGRTYRWEAGGEPYADGYVETVPLRVAPGGMFAGRAQVAVHAKMVAQDQVLGAIQLWPQPPAVGQVPELTLTPASSIDEASLVLIARE